MNLSERSPQPVRRVRRTPKRLGIAAAGLSLALVAACNTESDTGSPASSEVTSSTASAPSELPASTIDTPPDVPAPAQRTVTPEVVESWCTSASIIKLVAPLFPWSEGAICTAREGGIGLSSMTVGGDLNTSVTVGESAVPLETIGATYPGYTCDETQCSRKDTGDVGVYLKAPDGLIVGAVYHNLADDPGSEQDQYEVLVTLARTAMDMVP